MQHLASQLEHGVDMAAAQVDVTVVESGVEPDVDLVGHTHRHRRLRRGEDCRRGDLYLELCWRFGLTLLGLGRALLGDRSGDLDD